MQITITKNYHSSRIDRFLREHFQIPQSLVAKLVREKKVKVNKKKIAISCHLQEGDTVSIYYFLESSANFEHHVDEAKVKEFSSWIVHEDENLLAINKPVGISSQSGSKAGLAVDVIAKAYFSEARITHRLDRLTSGIMVLAKNKFTAREVAELFASRSVEKKYYAIVQRDDVKSEDGVIVGSLEKDSHLQKMFVSNGEDVVTNYKITQKVGEFALAEVMPQSGKMHQIRAHFAHVGMPIVGDEKYHGIPHDRMFLHAYSISFDEKTFISPLPQSYKNLGFIAQ